MKRYSQHNHQGLVLFVALMALAVMSLAAVALIRSVDTNSQITGNLAFKQTASITSAYGLEAMADTIGAQPKNYALADDPVKGYYAKCDTFDSGSTSKCNGVKLFDEATWTDSNSQLAEGDGITAGKDPYGNTVRYIVERMCNDVGAIQDSKCLLASTAADNSSKKVIGLNTPIMESEPEPFPIYRVTVRITGPKNTISYVQSFFS